MASLLREKYPQERAESTKNVLTVLGRRKISEESTEAETLLITGSKAKEFAADVTAVLTEVLQNGEAGTIFCNEKMKRYQLDEKINKAMSENIDRLRGEAILSLHALCDYEYSPHSKALVVLTVTNFNMGIYPDCENALSSLLHKEWQTPFLNGDIISAILSRITSYIICLTN
ncbi:unnamed protein product [Enterobius vermicularis]|uniref:AAA_9 domain-containing protein n=1 Tax=Enterobius vermicularis TaxID=51028 RepID=A0A0N4V5Z3_ENTVE|nr:unnamed protein product [Enterobius vermicularis]